MIGASATKFYICQNFVQPLNEHEVKSERVKTERRTYTPEEDNVRVVHPNPKKSWESKC